METAINWGRYAEIFEYDAARHRLTLPQVREPTAAAVREPQ
jgi:NitT/TauT family transport system ATP-binding protein